MQAIRPPTNPQLPHASVAGTTSAANEPANHADSTACGHDSPRAR